MSINI